MDIQTIQGGLTAPAAVKTRQIRQQGENDGIPRTSEEGRMSAAHDEYIPGDKPAEPASGLYRIIHDEDGTPRIQYDSAEDIPSSEGEQTTTNTDQVDREIAQLQQKRERLVQQLSTADEGEAAALEQELAQVDRELSRKDNDTYRRQHAVIS